MRGMLMKGWGKECGEGWVEGGEEDEGMMKSGVRERVRERERMRGEVKIKVGRVRGGEGVGEGKG
jgi:hypothetical protein